MNAMILPLLLAMAGVAGAQQAPVPGAAARAAPEPDIVVQHRTDAAIARMVEAMTQNQRGAQVSRWNDAICPRVLDLDEVHTALIENRIAAVAKSVGVPVAGKPCTPSIVIVATADADALAKAVVDRHPGLFGDPRYGIRHGKAITDLKMSRPVRWMDASRAIGEDASRIIPADGSTPGPLTVYAYNGGSRLKALTREDAVSSLVIVDIRQLTHITWGQLADYLSIVTLARPNLSATPPDSIMSIFAIRDTGGRGPAGLTSTDLSMLHGLYHSDPSLSAPMQRSQIEDQVKKGIGAPLPVATVGPAIR